MEQVDQSTTAELASQMVHTGSSYYSSVSSPAMEALAAMEALKRALMAYDTASTTMVNHSYWNGPLKGLSVVLTSKEAPATSVKTLAVCTAVLAELLMRQSHVLTAQEQKVFTGVMEALKTLSFSWVWK